MIQEPFKAKEKYYLFIQLFSNCHRDKVIYYCQVPLLDLDFD